MRNRLKLNLKGADHAIEQLTMLSKLADKLNKVNIANIVNQTLISQPEALLDKVDIPGVRYREPTSEECKISTL